MAEYVSKAVAERLVLFTKESMKVRFLTGKLKFDNFCYFMWYYYDQMSNKGHDDPSKSRKGQALGFHTPVF